MLEVSIETSYVTWRFQLKFQLPINKAQVTFLMFYSSLPILKSPNLNSEDSSESWYFNLKLQIKTESLTENVKIRLKLRIYKGTLDVF